ncbi:MAG: sigma 54-interacting transcriptional regulator [Desulfosarcinaceae bacterium]|jgi:two-component system response regulator AtoC
MINQAKQVLLVDDEEKLLKSIALRMKILGFTPHTAINGSAAIDMAKQRSFDLAIVDLQMPDMDGLVVITKLKEIDPQLRTVLLTGHGGQKVRQATESLNTLYFEKEEMGAFWRFIKKLNADGQAVVIRPASPPEAGRERPAAASKATRSAGVQFKRNRTIFAQTGNSTARDAGNRPDEDYREEHGRLRLIGETQTMQQLHKGIARAASLECTVTLEGEPGTGKELTAQIIHAGSRYAHRRFLAIDCANFGNAQLAQQLLGFTGSSLSEAVRSRSGIFGPEPIGTLFLDQVEKLPIPMQDQLLKTLIMAESWDAASALDDSLDMRFIVTTETDLAARVKTGAFKRNLYDHLSIFKLKILPLRERRDDILPLCWYFFDKYREELGKTADTIAPEVIQMLVDYDFPENVRELKYIIERAMIIVHGKTLRRQHLPARFLEKKKPERPKTPYRFISLAELEKHYIVEVLEALGGNKSKTAEILGISRAALWRKLKQLKAEASGQ